MFDAPMSGEVELRLLAEQTVIQVACMHDQLIVFRTCFSNNLSLRIDDNTAAD